jgi:hypothetical protein
MAHMAPARPPLAARLRFVNSVLSTAPPSTQTRSQWRSSRCCALYLGSSKKPRAHCHVIWHRPQPALLPFGAPEE